MAHDRKGNNAMITSEERVKVSTLKYVIARRSLVLIVCDNTVGPPPKLKINEYLFKFALALV